MVYQYINKDSGEIIEREYSMRGEIPNEIVFEGQMYHRYFGGQAIHIPDHMKAQGGVTEKRFDYGKKGKALW